MTQPPPLWAPPPPPKKNPLPWILTGLGVLLILALGLGAAVVFRGGGAAAPPPLPTAATSPTPPSSTVHPSAPAGKGPTFTVLHLDACEATDTGQLRDLALSEVSTTPTHREYASFAVVECQVKLTGNATVAVKATAFTDPRTAEATADANYTTAHDNARIHVAAGYSTGDVQGLGDEAYFELDEDAGGGTSYAVNSRHGNVVLRVAVLGSRAKGGPLAPKVTAMNRIFLGKLPKV